MTVATLALLAGAEAARPPSPGRASRSFRYAPESMLFFAGILGQTPSALGQTIDLLLTFLGIGVLVNIVIVYIVGQVLAERKQNQEPPGPAE